MPRSIENGQNITIISTSNSSLNSGSATSPSLAFATDPNSGIYSVADNSIGFTTNGTLKLTLSDSSLTSTLPYLGPNGSVSAPSYSFSADTNTGIYRSAADNLDFATNGVNRLNISTSNITSTLNIIAPTIRLTTGAASGRILTSDGSGNASWVAASSAPVFANVVKQSDSDVTCSATLNVVDIISSYTSFSGGKKVETAGWFEIQSALGNGNSITFDMPLSSWHTSSGGITITTNKGVARSYNTALVGVAFSISTNSNQCRLTITNNSGGTWSGGWQIAFNILTIGS